jgi:hypothetical protein
MARLSHKPGRFGKRRGGPDLTMAMRRRLFTRSAQTAMTSSRGSVTQRASNLARMVRRVGALRRSQESNQAILPMENRYCDTVFVAAQGADLPRRPERRQLGGDETPDG